VASCVESAAGFGEVTIVQRVKAPASILLRGTVFEKAVKRALQYTNYVLTKTLGRLGNRLLAIGVM